MRRFFCEVIGIPVPQGSMRAFTRRGGRVGMTHVNERELRSYRHEIGFAAHSAGVIPTAGAVGLELTFMFPRPKGHFRTGANAHRLTDRAPRRPIVSPDLSKLVRAVEDGLEGIAYKNDAQVVFTQAEKFYTDGLDHPKTTVRILQFEEEEPHGETDESQTTAAL